MNIKTINKAGYRQQQRREIDMQDLNIEMIHVIRSARKLLSEESRYTPDYPAIDKDNNEISPISEHAVAWNIRGALRKSVHKIEERYVDHYQELLDAVKLTLLYGIYRDETVSISKLRNLKQLQIINNGVDDLADMLTHHKTLMSYLDQILESADYVEEYTKPMFAI